MTTDKMRVLQLGKFFPIRGGVEKVMYELTLGLSAKGVECDMMSASFGGRGFTRQLNPKARLICCRTWTKAFATMIAPSMITTLRRTCNSYDIIHVHHPDPMACMALLLSGYRGKVVLHWHSDILKQAHLLKMYKPLQSWLLRRADVVIGTTPVYLAGSPYLTNVQHKTSVLPIGIDSICPDAKAVEAVRSRYGGRKIIFTLGRLVHYKGYKYLIEAARLLNDSYVVLIGGTGPLRDELQSSIDAYGLGERVHLLGRIPDEELPSYYGACTLFCLPSVVKTEAFGIVQIEAMSCGKPVIATRIPQSGVAWVNAHDESGINVEPANPEQLAVAIRSIADDEATYHRFSQGARQRYEQVFTKTEMINKVINIYKNLWKQQK